MMITPIKTMIEMDTSVNPITHPALKAVLKALPKDYLASSVVLKLE
jgi:hypothetical protein